MPLAPRPFPRRVAFIVRYAEGVGGTEAHVVSLARDFARAGIAVLTVISEDPPADGLAKRLTDAGSEVLRLTTDRRYGTRGLLQRLPKLAKALRAFRPDVVHVQSGTDTGGLPLLLIGKLATRATVVHTEHLFPGEGPLRWKLSKRAGDVVTDALIAVSRANAVHRRRFIRCPERRFAAILNGVPLEPVDPLVQARNRATVRGSLSIPPDAVVPGAVVRLAVDKGIDDLLNAFALLPLDRDVRLLLVGDGALRAELEALAATLGIADRVIFAGTQADPVPYLDAMDAFVLPVPVGSMSIALLEAMARGLPPVITFCGPEEAVINEETGLCAPPRDPAGLAAVLGRIVSDAGLCKDLGAAAAAHVRRHFTSERVARDVLDVYAAARKRRVPKRLRADGPVNARP